MNTSSQNVRTQDGNGAAPIAPISPGLASCTEAVDVLRAWIEKPAMWELGLAYGKSRRWLTGNDIYVSHVTGHTERMVRATRLVQLARYVTSISACIAYDLDYEGPPSEDDEENEDDEDAPYLTDRRIIDVVQAEAEAALKEQEALQKLKEAKAELKAARLGHAPTTGTTT